MRELNRDQNIVMIGVYLIVMSLVVLSPLYDWSFLFIGIFIFFGSLVLEAKYKQNNEKEARK